MKVTPRWKKKYQWQDQLTAYYLAPKINLGIKRNIVPKRNRCNSHEDGHGWICRRATDSRAEMGKKYWSRQWCRPLKASKLYASAYLEHERRGIDLSANSQWKDASERIFQNDHVELVAKQFKQTNLLKACKPTSWPWQNNQPCISTSRTLVIVEISARSRPRMLPFCTMNILDLRIYHPGSGIRALWQWWIIIERHRPSKTV